MKESSISRHWMTLENGIQSEPNLAQDENWMAVPQGSLLSFFLFFREIALLCLGRDV